MKRQTGQALVLVLLSLAVVLTLVLYILSRSVTDIAVSSRSEEAVRAFSAAEAGVENALIIGANLSETEIGDARYSANVSGIGQGLQTFNYPLSLFSGDTATLWFADHDSDGNVSCDAGTSCFTGDTVKVCWGKPGTYNDPSVVPAIELSVFYLDGGVYKIGRDAIDPVNTSRTPSNSFNPADGLGTCSIEGETYQFQKTFDLTALGATGQLQFARVRMLYNLLAPHNVGFDVNFAGNGLLPSQGLLISSTGTAGESNRRLEVFQGWPEAPGVFDYAVYSSTGLTK
jgi:hypothetical protein